MRFMSLFVTETALSRDGKATPARRWGQTAVAGIGIAGLAASLSACDPQKPAAGVVGYVAGFAGFVSAEEPRAALNGEDILSAGGTAADAAVTIASTLTVTLPSRAGWMGGGVCLSRNPKDKTVQVYSFLPEPLPGGGFAPGMPRGLYALQAASGVLRWEQVLAPAENLARFGSPVSRALAKDLAVLGSPATLDAGMRAIFTGKDGNLLREGEPMMQLRTATAMTALRMQGVGEAYGGTLGMTIAAQVPERGEDRRAALRAYRAQVVAPVTVQVDNETAYFPPKPYAGDAAARAWKAAGDSDGKNPAAARIAAANPALSGYGITGFTVVDRGGMAVSCALTMGQMFGGGHVLGDTGLLAYSPMGDDLDVDAMLPMLVTNTYVKDLRLAAVGVGATGVPDVMEFAVRGRLAGQKAPAAVTAAASHGEATSRVTGVLCPDGAPIKVDTCTLANDPRGAGISRAVGIEVGKPGARIILQ